MKIIENLMSYFVLIVLGIFIGVGLKSSHDCKAYYDWDLDKCYNLPTNGVPDYENIAVP